MVWGCKHMNDLDKDCLSSNHSEVELPCLCNIRNADAHALILQLYMNSAVCVSLAVETLMTTCLPFQEGLQIMSRWESTSG